MKCVLIETNDNRQFFTHEKYFIQLIEFSKAFNAEISIVKLEEGSVLELEELAPAICNSNYTKPKLQYSIIKRKNVKTRTEILHIANQVKKYIFERFQSRNFVSVKDLKNKFKKYNLTDSALCNHIRRVKQEFEKEGFQIVKTNSNQYKVC